MDSKRLYTDAERIARRKACKAASDARRAGRPFNTELVKRRAITPSKPATTVAEYMANGGQVQVLPGFRYVPSRVMPVGARYG